MQYIGSIIGDYCGAVYEWSNTSAKSPDEVEILTYGKFTDDTVLTVAVMDWLNKCEGKDTNLLVDLLKKWTRLYPTAGYGRMYHDWAFSERREPFGSFGNGSAMRVAPCAYFANTLEECLEISKNSAIVTHNHEEGIKGAQAVAEAIYLARCGADKDGIKKVIEDDFKYSLNRPLNELGTRSHRFDATCQITVPEALICFLNSKNFLDCIRTSIWIGGDSDTIAAISGGIAEAYYGIPSWIEEKIKEGLPSEMKNTIREFNNKMLRR